MAALTEQLQETIRVARQAEAEQAAQQAAEQANPADNETGSNDQQVSESKAPAIDELTLDAEEPDVADDDRNKRFLSFSLGGSGGGAGGSGNFLFDIIRRTADRAARAAGTVYRVVAGTESLDLNDTGSQRLTTTTTIKQQQSQETGPEEPGQSIDKRTSGTYNDGLFSGSVGTQQTDEKANAPISGEDTATIGGDGYTEGIPGPVTRLFVLANRGIANLIQDLILRIAQTSERIVNFKARLITSLI
ncbi:unnamed protein product [Hermetia illucens]|uniref:Uncharacterized protein n=2 Tax=Hermetia illucens TaxID=343691 RepID=A0A7R8YZ23_HERIL|nr:unnamed protein product [Hermetia illucens]